MLQSLYLSLLFDLLIPSCPPLPFSLLFSLLLFCSFISLLSSILFRLLLFCYVMFCSFIFSCSVLFCSVLLSSPVLLCSLPLSSPVLFCSVLFCSLFFSCSVLLRCGLYCLLSSCQFLKIPFTLMPYPTFHHLHSTNSRWPVTYISFHCHHHHLLIPLNCFLIIRRWLNMWSRTSNCLCLCQHSGALYRGESVPASGREDK